MDVAATQILALGGLLVVATIGAGLLLRATSTAISRDRKYRVEQQDQITFQATLLDQVRNAVIATETDGRLVYMNAYAQTLFQVPWQEAKNKPLNELGLLPASVTSVRQATDDEAHLEREETEITACRHDGKAFPALCVTTRATDPTGAGWAAVHVIHDLTESKEMEETVRHSANLALIGRMSASLVHEISQPMNVIRLTADAALMKLGRGPLTGEETAERLSTISQQAARLLDTIDYMQSLARRDAGDNSKLVPIDVSACITEAVALVQDACLKGDVALTLDLPQKPVIGMGQARQMEQVLANLLTNAVQAMSAMPPAKVRQLSITLHAAAKPSNLICIDIDDTGPGIPVDRREAVFQPFFTTKPPGEGTGLGLAICRGLISSMKATLDVGDSPLGGARFEVRLKAAPLQSLAAPLVAPSPTLSETTLRLGTAPHVLVVDDELLARDAVANHLRGQGFTVTTASGGHQALDYVQRFNGDGHGPLKDAADTTPIEAVITDISMPDGDGFTLIARIAADYPQVFTVVMTGQPLEHRRALEQTGSGADVVLRKPISLKDLEATLLAMLTDSDHEVDA